MSLILLDRDGVINENLKEYVKHVHELRFIDGSIKAIADLLESKHKISVCSNQRGVARGLVNFETLKKIENRIEMKLAKYTKKKISSYHYCIHDINDDCNCRKPKPGLLNQAIKVHFPLKKSLTTFVGDSYSDYLAAKAIKMNFVLLRTGLGKKSEKMMPKNIKIFDDLESYVSFVLGR